MNLLKSVTVSMITSLILLVIMAFFMFKFEVDGSIAKIMVYAIYFISGLTGGFISGKLLKRKRVLWAIATGAIYCLILMCGLIGSTNILESSIVFLWVSTLIGAITGGILS